MPTLYPSDLATAPSPFVSIDAMWLAFQVLATNKTPALNGEKHYSLPPLAGLSLHSNASDRSQSRSAAPPSLMGRVGSSRNNPVVMSVASVDQYYDDPFTHSYQHWPAEPSHWDEVFNVSDSFNTNDPSLWTPLVSPQARSQAFRDNKGRCLNCHDTDHSLKHCTQPFTNSSGCLNPQLGQLGDNGDGFCRWQQRMRSYRRRENNIGNGNTRTSPPSNRRNTSSRYQDNNARNNHGGKTHAPSRHNSRHQGQGNYRHGSSPHDAGRYPPSQLGQDARNSGNSNQSLTVFRPNSGPPAAAAPPAGPPNMRYGASHNAQNNNRNSRNPGTFHTGSG